MNDEEITGPQPYLDYDWSIGVMFWPSHWKWFRFNMDREDGWLYDLWLQIGPFYFHIMWFGE